MIRMLSRRSLAFALALALAPTLHAYEAGDQTHSASWWDPADSGWGLATLDQGNVLGPYWFSYDEQGKPFWLMGLTLPQQDGSYSGDLYRFTGTPFSQASGGSANWPGNIVGTVRLDFDANPKKMRFTTVIDGATAVRNLTRFNFSGKDVVCKATPDARDGATNYTDMWWDPSTSGWGIHVLHVDEKLYGQWYTYEAPDRAVFMLLDLTRQADGSYAGKVYRQKDGGRPFKASPSNQPSQPGSEEIGSASLIFLDGNRAEFDFVIGGREGHHVVQRFQVGTAANLCEVQPYDTGNGGGGNDDGNPSDGELCYPPYRIGDTRTVRSTGTSNGTAGAPHTYTEAITGNASFNGQNGLVQTISGQTSAGNGIYARNYLGNGDGTIASFGAEAIDPSNGQVISTSRNDPARVEMSRRFPAGQTVSIAYGVNSTSAAGNGRTDIKTTYRLLGRESVTVPAGTFNACKFEVTIEETTNVAGVTTRTLLSGHNWTDGNFGRIRQQYEGTSTVNAFGFNTITQLTSAEELLEATMNGEHKP